MISNALAERLLFFPSRTDPGLPPPLPGARAERVGLITADGVEIFAWWYGALRDTNPCGTRSGRAEPERSEPQRTGRDRPRAGASPRRQDPNERPERAPGGPVVLLLHGNAGNVSDRLPLAHGLVVRGLSVVLLEYRGFGGNAGRPSEEGLHRDALAGLALAAERAGNHAGVVLFGRSVGGPVAARVAGECPVGALILEATFTSLHGIARAVYPAVPAFLLRGLRGHYDTRTAAARIHTPLLVIHGVHDEIVPASMGREVFEAAPEPKAWYPVPGAGHNDVYWVGGGAYFDRIAGFVGEALPTSGPEAEPPAGPR